MTFSEKGTKIPPQTHIRKFEIIEISLWNPFQSAVYPLDWCGTLFWTEDNLNRTGFTDIVWEMKDFKFLFGSDFCSFLRKSCLYPTHFFRIPPCLHFPLVLMLTSKKSNEVNWKAIKSIPWAVHDLPNWHDLKSKLISKLRQNTVSSWLEIQNVCFFRF